MYFIHRGAIDIIGVDKSLLARLGEGSFFGEAALLTSKPRSAGAVSDSYCDLYILSRESFEKVLGKHPQLRTKFHQRYATQAELVGNQTRSSEEADQVEKRRIG